MTGRVGTEDSDGVDEGKRTGGRTRRDSETRAGSGGVEIGEDKGNVRTGGGGGEEWEECVGEAEWEAWEWEEEEESKEWYEGGGLSSAPGVALLRTRGVSRQTGRGRHTTRTATLIDMPRGGLLADTPGFNLPTLEVGWWGELPCAKVGWLSVGGLWCHGFERLPNIMMYVNWLLF